MLQFPHPYPVERLRQRADFCHIAWSLVSGDLELTKESFEALVKISQFLEGQTSSLKMILSHSEFGEYERKFINDEITADELRDHLKKIGLWAKVEYDDGRPSYFIGEAVPPNSK